MAHLNLNQTVDGRWQLEGELTFASLSQHYQSLLSQRPKQSAWQLDCRNITRIDSAGIAYMLDCIRYAELMQLSFSVTHLPPLAHGLMQAQGVAQLIAPYLKEQDESIN